MIISNVKVITGIKHQNSIINIFHFENNYPTHFASLSEDGELIEWGFDIVQNSFVKMETCTLLRPSDDILTKSKHKVLKIPKNDYMCITRSISFKNFIALGYEDGLITVYQQGIQSIGKKDKQEEITKSISKEEHNEKVEQSEEQSKENEEVEDDKEEIEEKEDDVDNVDDDKVVDNKKEENTNKIKEETKPVENPPIENEDNKPTDNISCYSNYFNLHYVLLGHTQKITSLQYIESTNMLVSSSESSIVKIYNMENGHSIYHFNLDSVIDYIIYFEKKKDKFIGMISQEPYKLIINISKDPITYNHFTFKYNNISQILKSENGFYLLGKSNFIYYFDSAFDFKEQYEDVEKTDYTYLCQYKKNLCVFDSYGYFRYIEMNKDKKAIITLFKIKIAEDAMNASFLVNDCYYLFACSDGIIYADDIDKEIEIYLQRKKMLEEDEFSNEMNLALENKKTKKGKGGDKKK